MAKDTDDRTSSGPSSATMQEFLCTIPETRRLKSGQCDPLGDKVDRVLICTDRFIIYSVKKPTSATDGDVGRAATGPAADHVWLRTVLPDSYECARQLRAKLALIAVELASICDTVDSLCRSGSLSNDRSATLRQRTIEMMARAMEMAFEGHDKDAKALLARVGEDVTTLRDSRNRMQYVTANAVMLFIWLFVWSAARLFWTGNPVMFAGAEGGISVHLIDVLALGAVGAFFSVSSAISSVRVNHSITWKEMLYAGAVRIPIGIIAAGVTVLLISGGWILGSIEDRFVPWCYLLFGFLAGFSEMFVPNALNQLESTQVRSRSDRETGDA